MLGHVKTSVKSICPSLVLPTVWSWLTHSDNIQKKTVHFRSPPKARLG